MDEAENMDGLQRLKIVGALAVVGMLSCLLASKPLLHQPFVIAAFCIAATLTAIIWAYRIRAHMVRTQKYATEELKAPRAGAATSLLAIGIGVSGLSIMARALELLPDQDFFDATNVHMVGVLGSVLMVFSLMLPGSKSDRATRQMRLLVDSIFFATIVAAAVWVVLQHTVFLRHWPTLTNLAGLLQPFTTLVLLFGLILRAGEVSKDRPIRPALTIVGGVLTILTGQTTQVLIESGMWHHRPSLAPYVLVSIGLMTTGLGSRWFMDAFLEKTLQPLVNGQAWRSIAPYLCLLGMGVFAALIHLTEPDGPGPEGVRFAVTALLGLIMFRQVFSLKDVFDLNEALSRAFRQLEAKNAETEANHEAAEQANSELQAIQSKLHQSYAELAQKSRETHEYALRLSETNAELQSAQEELTQHIQNVEKAYQELAEMRRDLLRSNDALASANLKLLETASKDGMTGLINHRSFQEQLRQELDFYHKSGQNCSLMLCDVDYFKLYNDKFGHPAGDEALKMVANILRENVRAYDVVARYGGEEFAVLLLNTDVTQAMSAAERLRELVEEADFPFRSITLSVGVADSRQAGGDPSLMISGADSSLYLAKRHGRNQFWVWGWEPEAEVSAAA